MTRRRTPTWLLPLLAFAGCGEERAPSDAPPAGSARFEPEGGFFAMPFPNPLRVRDDGTLAVRDFPNPAGNPLVARLLDALETLPSGPGANAAVFIPFSVALAEASLASGEAPASASAPFQLVDVDPASPARGAHVPLRVSFKKDAETYGPANLLALLPEPGFVLRPRTLHAALVLDGARDAAGRPLVTPPLLRALLAGEPQPGAAGERLGAAFAHLRAQLARDGIDPARVRAATVFRTGDPRGSADQLRDAVAARPMPEARELRQLRLHDTFCVVEGRVTLPLFQSGERPFTTEGGAIRFDAAGAPAVTGEESVRFALAIPRRAPPAAGYPLLVYAAGQGGSYTQFVDRGPMAEEGTVTGRGLAYHLADVGVASISIEAPLVGPRHPTGATDGFDFFNVKNASPSATTCARRRPTSSRSRAWPTGSPCPPRCAPAWAMRPSASTPRAGCSGGTPPAPPSARSCSAPTLPSARACSAARAVRGSTTSCSSASRWSSPPSSGCSSATAATTAPTSSTPSSTSPRPSGSPSSR